MTELKPIANPNVAGNTRDPEDPYVKGFNDGKKFAEDRAYNLSRLDAGSFPRLHCDIDRSVWRAALNLWQEDTKSPFTYLSPEALLSWIVIRVPELKYFNAWAEGQGYTKGFLAGKGIKAKTGEL